MILELKWVRMAAAVVATIPPTAQRYGRLATPPLLPIDGPATVRLWNNGIVKVALPQLLREQNLRDWCRPLRSIQRCHRWLVAMKTVAKAATTTPVAMTLIFALCHVGRARSSRHTRSTRSSTRKKRVERVSVSLWLAASIRQKVPWDSSSRRCWPTDKPQMMVVSSKVYKVLHVFVYKSFETNKRHFSNIILYFIV